MAKNKRFSMMYAPGKNGTLGMWPDDLEISNGGWTQKAWRAYEQALNLGHRYHDMNSALHLHQQAPHTPPPELGDVVTRQQLAKAEAKKLEAIHKQIVEIDTQVTKAQMALTPSMAAPILH
jgi:hypothetical protein